MITVKFSKDEQVAIGENFVSNGHWAIKTESVANAKAFASVEIAGAVFSKNRASKVKLDIFGQLPAESELLEWRSTSWILEGVKKQNRAFRCSDGRIALFNTKYLEMLGMNDNYSVLFGDSETKMFCNAKSDATVVIMPVKMDSHETLRPMPVEDKETVAA